MATTLARVVNPPGLLTQLKNPTPTTHMPHTPPFMLCLSFLFPRVFRFHVLLSSKFVAPLSVSPKQYIKSVGTIWMLTQMSASKWSEEKLSVGLQMLPPDSFVAVMSSLPACKNGYKHTRVFPEERNVPIALRGISPSSLSVLDRDKRKGVI